MSHKKERARKNIKKIIYIDSSGAYYTCRKQKYIKISE
jgi:transcription initiation factor IIE alpha subunit